MMFQVKFQLPNDRCLHIRNLTTTTGMDAIRLVRDEVGAHIPTRNITVEHSCPAFNNSTYNVFPSEEHLDQINAFGVFDAKDMVTVVIPDGFLGKYWDMTIENTGIVSDNVTFIKRMTTMDRRKVSSFKASFDVNNNNLITDWIAAGCPLTWTAPEMKISDSEFDPNIIYSTLVRDGKLGEYSYSHQSSRLVGDNIKDIVLTHNQFTKNDHEVDKVICIIRNSDVPAIINMLVDKLSMVGLRQLITLCQDRLDHFEKDKH